MPLADYHQHAAPVCIYLPVNLFRAHVIDCAAYCPVAVVIAAAVSFTMSSTASSFVPLAVAAGMSIFMVSTAASAFMLFSMAAASL